MDTLTNAGSATPEVEGRRYDWQIAKLTERALYAATQAEPDESKADLASDAWGFAQDTLFATPAPDLAGLRYKLEMLLSDQNALVSTWVTAVQADIARLMPNEPTDAPNAATGEREP